MTITLIAACDLNMGLGYKNELLVKLENDMKHFRQLTEGNFIVMGRKTYESIGHPLPKRSNIVLTHDKKYKTDPSVYIYHTTNDILHEYNSYGEGQVELFICGGEQIYKEFLPHADRAILTLIDHEFPKIDTYFPRLPDEFKPVSRQEYQADDKNLYDHSIITYERKHK